MKTKIFPYMCFLLAGLLILLAAQTAKAQDDQGSPPPARVATLDYMQGSVSYEPAGEQNWVDAELNRPLTTGDSLWSDQSSRAELFIGSTALRLGDSTGISFLNLSNQVAQVQLAEGTLEVDVRYLDPNESYEIDTPNLAFSILRPGEYVLTADPNGGQTSVSVYSGQGSATGGGQTYNVTPGEDALFSGTSQLTENVQGLPARDNFDNWARAREMRDDHSVSARYVSPGVTGYEDLDEYGSWHSNPDYGNYWVPNDVNTGWAPYHVGHWCWIAPWGWTWVDDEPWGFAPFHYGRWAMIDGSWGWVPGPAAVAPVYAPALVGFVGGGGFGVAVSFGTMEGVGWYPLGPRDVYIPPYQVDPEYVQRINYGDTRYVNRTTVTNVYNNYTVNHVTYGNYTYANNTRAVTVVNRNTFVNGAPVQRNAVRVDATQIQHPRVVTTAALTPTHTSVVGAAVPRVRRAPPARLASRRVVTKLKPSPRAEPLGRPRPATNPNLRTAVLKRSGYSPQLQMIRARAAAKAPAKAPARNVTPAAPARPATAPKAPARPAARPTTPARPALARPGARPPTARPPAARSGVPRTPPARTTPPERPGTVHPAHPANPARPGTNRPAFPRSQPRPGETRPAHPFTPPNRPPTRPGPVTPPRRPPVRPPNRPVVRPQPRPQPQPRPEARPIPPPRMPARRIPPPRPEARPPARRPVPRPEARPPARRPMPRPAPRPQPERRPPPPKKKPGGPGGNGSGT